jgi:hypothetical protein
MERLIAIAAVKAALEEMTEGVKAGPLSGMTGSERVRGQRYPPPVRVVGTPYAYPRGMTGGDQISVRAGYPRNAMEDARWNRRLRQIYRGLPGDPKILGGEEGFVRNEKRLRGEMDDWTLGRYTSDTAYNADDDWRNTHPGGRLPTAGQRQQARDQFLRERWQTLPQEMRMEIQGQPPPLVAARERARNAWQELRGGAGRFMPGSRKTVMLTELCRALDQVAMKAAAPRGRRPLLRSQAVDDARWDAHIGDLLRKDEWAYPDWTVTPAQRRWYAGEEQRTRRELAAWAAGRAKPPAADTWDEDWHGTAIKPGMGPPGAWEIPTPGQRRAHQQRFLQYRWDPGLANIIHGQAREARLGDVQQNDAYRNRPTWDAPALEDSDAYLRARRNARDFEVILHPANTSLIPRRERVFDPS